MSNLSEVKLLLSGNLYLDLIVDTTDMEVGYNSRSKIIYSLGGVANIARELSKLKLLHKIRANLGFPLSEKNLKVLFSNNENNLDGISLDYITFYELPMSIAIILFDKKKSTRSSFVSEGVSRDVCFPSENLDNIKFHHISYLDNLPEYRADDLRDQKSRNIFLSADLCLNDYSDQERRDTIEKIRHLNLLFLSDSEYSKLFLEPATDSNLRKNSYLPDWFIVHSAKESWYGSLTDVRKIGGEKITGINTIGFGDLMVANFLYNFIDGKSFFESAEISFKICQSYALSLKEI
jgi:sugar/nucleoside kinase (ribokinase family)